MHISQRTNKPTSINLLNVENGIITIEAPNADVQMTVKSLQDSCFVNCRNLTVFVTDDFFGANFVQVGDQGVEDSLLDTLDEIKEMGPRPTLFIKATGTKEIKVMSSFDILRQQIMSKIQSKPGA